MTLEKFSQVRCCVISTFPPKPWINIQQLQVVRVRLRPFRPYTLKRYFRFVRVRLRHYFHLKHTFSEFSRFRTLSFSSFTVLNMPSSIPSIFFRWISSFLRLTSSFLRWFSCLFNSSASQEIVPCSFPWVRSENVENFSFTTSTHSHLISLNSIHHLILVLAIS